MEQEAKLRYSKRLRSGTRRRYQDDGISDDEIEGKRTFDLEDKLLSNNYSANFVHIMEGKDFSIEYIQREGLRTPLVFTNSEGLGLKMPGEDFSVNDVKYFVGSRRMIDVMDVTTQKGIEMSMAQWRRYYETPPEERDKLYNVISLEFSHTKLENLVQRPASVDKIDWVDNMWPRHLKERQRDSTNAIFDMKYPKVQKYCLMSVQGCYTDFHIDFGGTSVWYHVLKGGKVFWLIPPTPQNLELYENWVLSGKQGDIFLGDKALECQRIQLKQGYTFMIPSGWIHAVYTPVDTIVFGGNFLHSFNIPMQLHIYNIEDRTRVPAKFRYPFYYEMCWYVLERYLYSMTKKSFLTVEFQRESLGIGLEPEVNGNLHNGDAFDDGEHEDKSPESGSPEDGGGGGGGGIKDESGNSWIHLTAFELEGLKNLVGKLESLPSNKKCIPAGIQNPDGLLIEMKKLLEEHSNDDLELACTGIPIVKWPKRPPSYQPPTPLPVGRPKMNIYPTGSRPVRSNLGGGSRSSVSVLRRRRVRCRKCAACTRRECGECNFCRDMKKNGGPGRLKQSCVLRQCLSPGLPLSAVCAACNEGTQDPEEATDLSLTLMECSSCSEIMHPKCIDVPGEGEINKDLLNCWVCPKCVLARREESQTESEEDSASPASPASADLSASTIDYDKRGLRGSNSESRVGGKLTASHTDGRRRHLLHNAINQNPASAAGQRHRRLTPAQQQYQEYLQQRKRKLHTTTSLELRHKKKMKLEREKLFLQARRKAYEVGSRYSRLKILRPLRSREDSSGTASSSLGGSAISRTRMNSSSSKRGRGMSTRSCDRGKNEGVSRYPTKASSARMDSRENLSLRSARFRRRQEQLQSSVPTGATGVPNKQGQVIIQGKENRPNQTQGMSADEECLDSDGDMSTEPTVVIADLGEELERARLKGSYLTVTLQRPPKAFNGSSIVPKLQAIPHCPSGTQGSLRKHPRVIPRLEADNEMDDVQDQDSETYCTGSALNGSPPGASNGGIAMKGISLSSRGIIDDCRDPTMQKEIWMSVFRYLTRKELCDCMAVCKTWYKWCCDKKLWMKIDLSRCRSISPQALSGIIKRQPIMLDLSWTNISKKQLAWLINRLPGLKDLILAGCTWSSISALSTSSCPLLRTLDLRWAEGVKDSQIRDLLTPPGADNRSKLRNMVSFRLAGLEITDATLRLIIRHMPLLARLDISHCTYVTDQSVNLLTAVGSSTRNSLTEINLAGCNKLTDQCLVFLKRISNVTLIDLRGCKGITRRACEQFISDLSINTLYCLSDEKLIQKIG